MTRYKLTIEYDGAPFVGWQRQDNGPSIQGALEDAVFAFCGERAAVHGAGRTDTGVHALGQVAHLDLAAEKPIDTVQAAVNFHLKPNPIVITQAEIVPGDFHARFSATARRYRYLILNRRAPPALDRGRVWHVPVPLDAAAMADAATLLIGRHDFNSFRSAACQAASPLKTLDQLDVARDGDLVRIDVHELSLDLLVSDDELASRRDGWEPRRSRYTSGVLGKYARLVQGAETGAITNTL